MIHPVILSGGAGTRLWPMSRALYPKQLLNLVGPASLLQQTALRVAGDAGRTAPLVVANEEHRFVIAEQLREIGQGQPTIVLEPVARNTAPAVAAAALLAAQQDPEALILVMPADHVVTDPASFNDCVATAVAAAREGWLVTLGIEPTSASTAFG